MGLLSFGVDIKSSIVISEGLKKTKRFVENFNNWSKFSPWMILDEEATNAITKDGVSLGSVMSWKGEFIGEGEIEIVKSSNDSIVYDLRFIKPFKSKATTWFSFENLNEKTRVTWHMKSSMPIFMVF